MGRSVEGWGASGRTSDCVGDCVGDGVAGPVGCCAERVGRPRKRIASRRAPLRTLLVIAIYRPHAYAESRIGQRGSRGGRAIVEMPTAHHRLATATRPCRQRKKFVPRAPAYSRRNLSMMGNLRATLGKNSSTKFPPASVTIDVKKVRLTTLAVTLGSG